MVLQFWIIFCAVLGFLLGPNAPLYNVLVVITSQKYHRGYPGKVVLIYKTISHKTIEIIIVSILKDSKFLPTTALEMKIITVLSFCPGGGGGDSHMEWTGMLVGNFEFNP